MRPECAVGLLICPRMLAHEAITITGAERFSKSSGYNGRLQYAGDYVDPTPRDAEGCVEITVVVIDAKKYDRQNDALQFEPPEVEREARKAYAGFSVGALAGVAAGVMGAGAGDADIPKYTHVTVHDLADQPTGKTKDLLDALRSFDGKEGMVEGFDRETKRYSVRFSSGILGCDDVKNLQ